MSDNNNDAGHDGIWAFYCVCDVVDGYHLTNTDITKVTMQPPAAANNNRMEILRKETKTIILMCLK